MTESTTDTDFKATLVVKLKSGETKTFQCKEASDGHKAIALCVGVYHYLPSDPPIPLDDIEDMQVEENP